MFFNNSSFESLSDEDEEVSQPPSSIHHHLHQKIFAKRFVAVNKQFFLSYLYNEGHGILGSLLLSFQKVSM
jgi:hypothetical protein